jgi:predicted PurR-regulated permease PerM
MMIGSLGINCRPILDNSERKWRGVACGSILALGFAALDGAGLGRLAGVGAVFAIAQVIEDYVLTPRVIGGKLEWRPMLVFIALIIAGDLFGLLGLGVLSVVERS